MSWEQLELFEEGEPEQEAQQGGWPHPDGFAGGLMGED